MVTNSIFARNRVLTERFSTSGGGGDDRALPRSGRPVLTVPSHSREVNTDRTVKPFPKFRPARAGYDPHGGLSSKIATPRRKSRNYLYLPCPLPDFPHLISCSSLSSAPLIFLGSVSENLSRRVHKGHTREEEEEEDAPGGEKRVTLVFHVGCLSGCLIVSFGLFNLLSKSSVARSIISPLESRRSRLCVCVSFLLSTYKAAFAVRARPNRRRAKRERQINRQTERKDVGRECTRTRVYLWFYSSLLAHYNGTPMSTQTANASYRDRCTFFPVLHLHEGIDYIVLQPARGMSDRPRAANAPY